MSSSQPSRHQILDAHRGGKLSTHSTLSLRSKRNLSIAYTPGVAAVSSAIAENANLHRSHTIAGNTVAIVSDGSSILGLGNLGPAAAMPVMEGKAAILQQFAGLNAFPVCLATQQPKEIIAAVRAIAPSFAAINLEDIAAPQCFAIEDALQDLGIPVMHDDQHGTAIVVLAALQNATRVVGKNFNDLRVVVVGAGAAGSAITERLAPKVHDLILVDSQGMLCTPRTKLSSKKQQLLSITNHLNMCGSLEEALVGADVFIGVSRAAILTPAMIRSMATDSIIFALANPIPEIMPDAARSAGARVIATGRSDFPNQVNNALVYPGVFRGAIDAHAPRITAAMKDAAAIALAKLVPHPTRTRIIPSLFNSQVVPAVARAVSLAASES
jgi:malate dehydrogenase (oxaloacetate-decarboxylating)